MVGIDLSQEDFAKKKILIVVFLFSLLIIIVFISFMVVPLSFNPLELIKKQQDASIIKDSINLNRALHDFFIDKNCYPWDWQDQTGKNPGCRPPTQLASTGVPLNDLNGGATNTYGSSTIIPKLVSSGRISTDFAVKLSGYKPFINGAAFLYSTNPSYSGGYITMVAFQPSSKAFLTQATFFDSSCATSDSGTPKYICVSLNP